MDIDSVKELLHQNNFRITYERELVLDTFLKTEKIVTPAQLFELVQRKHVRVGLTTVYRLLEVLTKLDLTTPFLVNGEIYYTFCTHQHHHHFICLHCRRVQDVFECLPFQNISRYGTMTSHKIDLFGYCVTCEREPSQEVKH
ncbi:transcriptional repressor [Fodinisporobacter ferrooxydans]|uniref:Transcriptional repressor n=1 Tax=Fodinisporobacter ferrooxydans TaxID=2901836 RepID=A0ABY4CSR9_9BACL|nr:transcriptional repressor [Alicyclobacillaceae bacterium MYW30-H2]